MSASVRCSPLDEVTMNGVPATPEVLVTDLDDDRDDEDDGGVSQDEDEEACRKARIDTGLV